jgi:glycosyltransferase involved in cell wall biosynthesis
MARWQFVYARRFAFSPKDYDSPGLGGSEAVLVVLTRALARLGEDVSVFACVDRPGEYDGVQWVPLHTIEDAPKTDVRVAVRHEESVVPADALNVFWMLDNRPENAASFRQRVGAKEPIVVASEAMRRLLRTVGVFDTYRIDFPVETTEFSQFPVERRWPICIFTSIHDRGLDAALSLWPIIRDAVPEAELHVTSGYELWGFARQDARKLQRQFAYAEMIDGVVLHGVLDRKKLRNLQSQAAVLLYPCREEEMFCLAVAEAGVAGTPAVTSNSYALMERVVEHQTGYLVDGSIDSLQTQAVFAATLEEVVCSFVDHLLGETGERTLVVAGGVFANVALNRRLGSLAGLDELHVHPGMTDSGVALGAAAWAYQDRTRQRPRPLENLGLGPSYPQAEATAPFLDAGYVASTDSTPAEIQLARRSQRAEWSRAS